MNVITIAKKRTRAYGDGSIIELGPGRFRVVVSGGRDPLTGRRLRPSVYARSLEEARIKKADLLGQRFSPEGPVLIDRSLRLGDWLDTWAEKKRDNERTHHFRLDQLRRIKATLGSVRLHRLTDEQVERLINASLADGPGALAPQTRKHVLSVLRTALKAACQHPQIRLARNPALSVNVKGYRDEFDPRILDDTEYTHFLAAARRFDALAAKRAGRHGRYLPMEAAWILFCERGLRQGELLGLRWSEVDLKHATIKVRQQLQRQRGHGSTKGKKKGCGEHMELVPLKTKSSRRTLRLSANLVAALRRHRAHHLALRDRLGEDWNPLDLVFPTITGLPMQASVLTHDFFRPVCDLAHIAYSDRSQTHGLRIHDLRHTFATRHIKQHKNIVLTKVVMGHSTVKMAERYVHLAALDEDIEEAAAE